MLRRSLLVLGIALMFGVAALAVALALPVESWRTGEPAATPLALTAVTEFGARPLPVWIDTDAACGRDARTDPDDCLALLMLAESPAVEVSGVSTVFGNAPLAVTDSTARTLMAMLVSDGRSPIPIARGQAGPIEEGHPDSHAVGELRAALRERPLTIVALGPLTNVAAALRDRPDLQSRVTRLVVVMGRRYGHLFHPAEGRPARSFFGHGPVFRDFNFAQDPRAAAEVLRMGIPMTLIPYEAARDVVLGEQLLDDMVARGGAAAWVAGRVRPWLGYWQDEINRNGFYPFDAVAAAFVIDPSFLRCAEVMLAVVEDAGLFGWMGGRGMFVVTDHENFDNPEALARGQYCPEAEDGLGPFLHDRLGQRRTASDPRQVADEQMAR